MDIDRNEIYETCREGGGLAMGAYRDGDLLFWDDGTHWRGFRVLKVIRDDRHVFRFKDDMGRELFLRALTLDGWERLRKIWPNLRAFADLDKLKAFLRLPAGR